MKDERVDICDVGVREDIAEPEVAREIVEERVTVFGASVLDGSCEVKTDVSEGLVDHVWSEVNEDALTVVVVLLCVVGRCEVENEEEGTVDSVTGILVVCVYEAEGLCVLIGVLLTSVVELELVVESVCSNVVMAVCVEITDVVGSLEVDGVLVISDHVSPDVETDEIVVVSSRVDVVLTVDDVDGRCVVVGWL